MSCVDVQIAHIHCVLMSRTLGDSGKNIHLGKQGHIIERDKAASIYFIAEGGGPCLLSGRRQEPSVHVSTLSSWQPGEAARILVLYKINRPEPQGLVCAQGQKL